MKKILIRALIGVAILVIVAVVIISLSLNGIVKKGVETIGPQIAKVEIKLDSVSLSVLSGSGRVKGLVVGNPEGYKAPQAISVGMASVSVSPGSVFSDKVVVRSIQVDSPEITFEGNPMKNNLSQILDNVNASTGGGKDSTQAEAGPGKKLQVNDFLITGAKVHVGSGVTVPLPDVHLTDLGTGPEGITVADLTQRILSAVVTSTLKTVAEKGVSEASKQAGEAVSGTLDKAGKGLGDLFKKK